MEPHKELHDTKLSITPVYSSTVPGAFCLAVDGCALEDPNYSVQGERLRMQMRGMILEI